MAEASSRTLVVLMTHGADDELSSVGFTIACGGLTAGLKVCVFLTSSAVDLVRKRAIDMTVVAPLSSLRDLVQDFMSIVITGASVMHEEIKKGAATLSF